MKAMFYAIGLIGSVYLGASAYLFNAGVSTPLYKILLPDNYTVVEALPDKERVIEALETLEEPVAEPIVDEVPAIELLKDVPSEITIPLVTP